MTLHRVVLVVLISLLNLQGSLQQTKPPSLKDIMCGRKKEFKAGDCVAAYRKIIYDGDSTLDHNERSVEKTSGSCVTHIENIKWLKVPKAIIENGFDQILAKCNGYAGNATLPGFDGVRLLTWHHKRPDPSSSQDDIKLNQVFCSDNPKDTKLVKQECAEAYRLIPTNAEGRFVSVDHHVPMNSIHAFYKKCSVGMWTSDGSKVMA
ncbi:hypothetical protein PGT21_017269 [Puccinia graminis f. sp. tritici]|uniref:Ecp2 effector protein domain-containing protein n=1 Tax=Puccinia graminis f. sp. tritici TaxID=56615 RepID=A0A5B0PFV9_PUCGR|nr:hypothetical protein PGTUg99_024846 [Puccinia graminis f. sp. tritici]KAA1099692.1 hypothetical protein PGT21_017269 [Puccinia graminis f. sp. tritici]